MPFTLAGQSTFSIHLDTVGLPGLPGLHSFAVGTHAGKWLLIGGRRDGMHQVANAFGPNDANQEIRVVQPESGQVWERALSELPDSLQEQLRSANMEFFQEGETLLFAGGYGRSDRAHDHVTFPYLTLIDVPGLMDAVMHGGALQPHFQQIRDTFFAVTGGQLQALADTFYLVGGHRFDGVYSFDPGASFTQAYTNAIRKFTLTTNANGAMQVGHRSEVLDELNFHRRDYNLMPQIFPNGEPGIAAFSGVFQPGGAPAPFLNVVEIRPSGYTSVNGFSQFLANYHCAKVALYGESDRAMHTLFFGGISQYSLDEKGNLIHDNRLPFVKTVSRVSRLADGRYEEVALDARMPYYTGASAEFIPAGGLPTLREGVVDYDGLPASGSQLLGYIVGGIVTPDDQPNPFVTGKAGLTSANTCLIRVFLEKNTASAAPEQPLDGHVDFGLVVSPNPAADHWTLRLNLPRAGKLRATLQNAEGQILRQPDWGLQTAGALELNLPAGDLPAGIFWLTLHLDSVFMETTRISKQ